ncbi:GntR family transcriptional regulator [Clostridium sp. AM58-1XD]|uniref:GntR family transcriptional regulator n=1 Tax=Clostridium sp. AM58-1XD TaxID=2292307 RepID=UPI0015F3CD13|nr:GntR family transcriptional regulator [Clostridium sp. AM58-1XD]
MKRFINKAAPLYINVRNAILDSIECGDIAQDGRLPSEEALAKYFSVSRPTIRSALQLLENDGIISKHHGSETIVNKACLNLKMRIDEAQGYWDLIKNSGHEPGILSLSMEPIMISSPINKIFGCSEEIEGYLLKKVYTADKQPVIFVKEYIPKDQLYRLPSEKELNQDAIDIFNLSYNYFQQPINYSILEISSIKPSPEVLEAMRFSSDHTLVQLKETHFNIENQVAAFSEIAIRDSIIQVQIVRKRFF